MDLFDKIGKTACKTYKMTTEKTSKLAKETKLKIQMNEYKTKIQSIYEEIGKKVYEHHINDEDISIKVLVEENCIEIDELCDRIEDARKELLKLKDRKQCPNCFYEIEKDYKYCPNCGSKQDDKQGEINKKENMDKEDIKQQDTEENYEEDDEENDII